MSSARRWRNPRSALRHDVPQTRQISAGSRTNSEECARRRAGTGCVQILPPPRVALPRNGRPRHAVDFQEHRTDAGHGLHRGTGNLHRQRPARRSGGIPRTWVANRGRRAHSAGQADRGVD
uniref:(northern house mosquito) hypothetical protein n=1 Tax=Culex pipiens TaxID=7175 RepID=A0A8D8IVZ2_CULPI